MNEDDVLVVHEENMFVCVTAEECAVAVCETRCCNTCAIHTIL